MKIAFATTDGINVDEHFGRAGKFVIYDLTPERYNYLETIKFSDGLDISIIETRGMGQEHEDRVQSKINMLAGCKIVYFTEIGGPAAAMLVKKGIMPVKVKETVTIGESLNRLLETAKASPPPWLKKALNQ